MKHSRSYKKWLKSRPEHIRKVAEQFDPNTCYRSKNNARGHYCLYSFDENEDGTVTLRIIHGRDSFFPGTMVFGIDPNNLVLCDCGKWEPATEEDLQETHQRLEFALLVKGLEKAASN